MRKHRLFSELHCYELTNLLVTAVQSSPSQAEWLNEILIKYLSDFQLYSYIELLTQIFSNVSFLFLIFLFYLVSFDCQLF